MKAVIIQNRQNIVDLAIQYYGSSAAVIDLCNDNDLELDSDVEPGTTILIQDSYPVNADSDYADYIKSAGIVVVSMSIAENDDETALGTNNDEFIITNDNNYISA